jgi:hypothetical protein
VNEETYDIHDVTRSAADLVAAGCSVGMTHIPDGVVRLRFDAIVSAYVDEVIKAVDEGVISARQALQEIEAEYEDLLSKSRFYLQNGIGVVAGVMQVRTGATIIGASGGVGTMPGALMVGHGVNNIYEGFGNIYRGPDAPSVVGPVRNIYRTLSDVNDGDLVYYSMDLWLSAYGTYRLVRKPGAVELFRRDPINYEMAYRQAGKLALSFEALVDFITLNTMISAEAESG